MNKNEELFCYICLDNDKDGEKLLGGVCSCRGGSGHCHLSCVVEHGKKKLADSLKGEFGFDAQAVRDVWWRCGLCKQHYRDDMIVKLAKKFNSLVCGKYPHNLELKIESLRFKSLAAEAENLSFELRESILLDLVAAIEDFLATGSGEMPTSVFNNQYRAYKALGGMALVRGDFSAAVDHYTKIRKLFVETAPNNKSHLMHIDVLIAHAKAKMPGVDTVSYLKNSMQLFEDFFELSKEMYGPVSQEALHSGQLLMHALLRSEQLFKSERQAVAMYKLSCQLHGATHPESITNKKVLDEILGLIKVVERSV